MKRVQGLPLIVIGALLILAPIIAHAIANERDKQRLIEFYRYNPNGALLPASLMPSGYAGYDWACFGVGVGIAFTGVGTMTKRGTEKPEPWERAEV